MKGQNNKKKKKKYKPENSSKVQYAIGSKWNFGEEYCYKFAICSPTNYLFSFFFFLHAFMHFFFSDTDDEQIVN